MPTQITNQARLTYTYGLNNGSATSNIASTMMQGPLSAVKSVLESDYRAESELTHIVTLTNTSVAALSNVTISDNLGRYAVSETVAATPQTYSGPAQLYLNGVFSASLTPVIAEDGVTFTLTTVPAGAAAMLIYKTAVNEFAPLTPGAAITNTVTVNAAALTEPLTVTAEVPVEAYADVSITKVMTPNPVTGGSTLTYAFTIYNYGNTAADNVVLSDPFNPAPSPITVTVDGTALAETDYSYTGGELTLPAAGSAYTLSIPAATLVQDPATGEVTVNPGVVAIVVAGVIGGATA